MLHTLASGAVIATPLVADDAVLSLAHVQGHVLQHESAALHKLLLGRQQISLKTFETLKNVLFLNNNELKTPSTLTERQSLPPSPNHFRQRRQQASSPSIPRAVLSR